MNKNIYKYLLSAILLMGCTMTVWAGNRNYEDKDSEWDAKGDVVTPSKDTDAITVIQGTDADDSYLLKSGVKFRFDGDDVSVTVGGESQCNYTLSEAEAIRIRPAHVFKLTANQDPVTTKYFLTTFYTSEGAYKVPKGVKAFIGKAEKTSDPESDLLNLTLLSNKLIHKSEGVVLLANQSEIILMPSGNTQEASADNMLTGTDVCIENPEYGIFGLTYDYQNGAVFNRMGIEIPANSAYLVLDSNYDNWLQLVIENSDVPIGIPGIMDKDGNLDEIEAIYDSMGRRLDAPRKGQMNIFKTKSGKMVKKLM